MKFWFWTTFNLVACAYNLWRAQPHQLHDWNMFAAGCCGMAAFTWITARVMGVLEE